MSGCSGQEAGTGPPRLFRLVRALACRSAGARTRPYGATTHVVRPGASRLDGEFDSPPSPPGLQACLRY